VTPQALLALAILFDLLEERLFDLGDALPHPHDAARLAAERHNPGTHTRAPASASS
jgi:hypothetical protein